MIIAKSDIISKIRKAIDDKAPSVTDSFTTDTDDELWQAVQHAVEQLLLELPIDMLIPTDGQSQTEHHATTGDDGTGCIELPEDFLRFVSLKLSTWLSPVYELIEPGSDEEMRQRTVWGRGAPEKPRAMLDTLTITTTPAALSEEQSEDSEPSLVTSTMKNVLRYWTAGKTGTPAAYNHTIDVLNYITMPTVETSSITCALKPVAEKAVIYRAASIFFEGKKEPETADKFRNI